MGCSGNCGSCGGCAKELVLTKPEVDMLMQLGQIPFLPVGRKMGEDTPVYLEEQNLPTEQYSLTLQCLEKKGLISLDYDMPLKGFDEERYAAYPVRGSMALTQRGQQVLQLMELQGFEEDN